MTKPPQTEHLPSASQAQRGEAIIEYVSAGLGAVSGGLSELVMLPARRVMERRLQAMEEAIVADLRDGRLSEEDVIEDERLASFILRVRRAAFEGVGKNKLRLMARIFLKDATSDDYSEDRLQDFWAITEQLNIDDMRVLALLKKADENGYFTREVADDRENRKIDFSLSEGEFDDPVKFNEAVGALLRFGLIDAVSGWGSLVYFATDRCLSYVRHLDFSKLD